MTLLVTVNEDASPGNHSIKLDHFFRTGTDNNENLAETINVRIGGVTGTPNVRLGSFRTVPTGTLSPNQTFTVTADIQNIGTATARDVRVSLSENTRTLGIFSTNADNFNQAVFTEMAAGHSSTLNFTFQISKDIKTNLYPIDFIVSFAEEGKDGRISAEFPFIVNVYSPEDDDTLATLEIREMNAPTGRINVGQTGLISFFVYNSGEAEARNIIVTATPDNETAVVPMTANTQVIPSLKPGEGRRVSFSFSPTRSSQTRSYTIRFRTQYEPGRAGEAAKTMSFDQFAAFNVYNPDEEDGDDDKTKGTQIPRVIVENYTVDSGDDNIPRAGKDFELEITFRNTNASVPVNNISIRLEEVSGIPIPNQTTPFAGFMPVGGSDTLFVDSLAPLGQVTRTLKYSTAMDATPGTHNIQVHFEYQDKDFNVHKAQQMITITIAQVTRLEIANVEVADFTSVGSPVWFKYDVINSGRVNLINVRVDTIGDFDTTEAQGFKGNLNAQRTLSVDGRFVPMEAGTFTGTFKIEAEDNTGEMVEAEFPFTITVVGGDSDFEGGDWGGAWDDGGGRRPPMIGGDFGFDEGGGENDDKSAGGFFKNLFTREVAPEDWNEEFMGEFNPETAARMGMEVERETRWVMVIGALVILLAVIATPILIIKKRSKKLDFDDED